MRHLNILNICLLSLLFIASAYPAPARVRYVKLGATGLNNGTSWANAYNSFDSLNNYVGDSSILDTFWVANGTYHPTNAFGAGFKPAIGARAIYGGFAGTETALSQRNWNTFQTIIDGYMSPNARSYVLIQLGANGNPSIYNPVNASSHFDGFKLVNSYGGPAMLYSYSSPSKGVIANCLFVNDSATGIFTANNNIPESAICITANSRLYNNAEIQINNCHFENNYGITGAAIGTFYSVVNPAGATSTKLLINDCSFINNTAFYGGAIANRDTSINMSIVRCLFKGNKAIEVGGAIYDSNLCKTSVFNSLFIGNSASRSSVWHCVNAPMPSAMTISQNLHKLIGCTIASNKDSSTSSTDYAVVLNGNDSIENCIFWDNATGSGQQISPGTGSYINNNIIQGGASGSTSTYTVNPLFVSPGSSSAAPFPATASYDYHLQPASPAIDLGLNGIVAPFGFNSLDLDKTPRTYGPAPDLGAYEQSYCLLPAVRIAPMSATICLSSADSILLTASGGGGAGTYTWIGQGSKGGGAYKGTSIWAKDSGLYQVMSYDTATGCRAQGSVYVRVVPKMTPVITISGSTLSVPAVYASYQWFINGAMIVGATSNTYTATSNGRYSIQVSIRAAECRDSATYNLTNLGIGGSAGPLEYLSVYPNPAHNGHFNISLDARQTMKEVSITVTDVTGRQVLSRQYSNPGKSLFEEISLSGAAPGIYFVRITADGEAFTRRLSVE